MSRTGSASGKAGATRSSPPVSRQRGVGSEAVAGESSQGTGHIASIDCVLGAKRARFSSRLDMLPQASMAKMSGIMSQTPPRKIGRDRHISGGGVR